MHKIYSAETLTLVEHVRAVLAHEGIKTSVHNQYLSGGLGQLPAFDCWPELWLFDDAKLSQAQAIIDRLFNDANDPVPARWVCQHCDETIEGQFAICWNCGTDSPNPMVSDPYDD